MSINLNITESDINLTSKEKFRDFLDTSIFGFIFILPVMLFAIILLPFLFIFGLTWENIIEKYWYKLTGKKRKHLIPDKYHPYSELPIQIEYQNFWEIDGDIDKLKEKFKMTDRDFDELEIGRFSTNQIISNLENRYFDWKTFVFDNKIFVQEVKLPEFKTSIGFIDCKELKYEIINDVGSYPLISFEDKGDSLEITLRQPKMKKIIKIKNTAANNT